MAPCIAHLRIARCGGTSLAWRSIACPLPGPGMMRFFMAVPGALGLEMHLLGLTYKKLLKMDIYF